MKKICLPAFIFILSVLFVTGCKKDKGEPPVMPPQESMIIDFSNFISTTKSLELLPGQKGTENSNWVYSATVAGYWNVIINTTLAVPIASYIDLLDQTPVYVTTKTWQWSYDVTYLNTTYKARLTGQIVSGSVNWKMYITGEGSGTNNFPEFLWMQGTSKSDGTSGQWILNENALDPNPFLQIDWSKPTTSVDLVKYTFVKAGDPFNSSYIIYGLTTNALNAYYTVHYYNGVKFSDVAIEWNTTTLNGQVQSVDYLGDSNWYCWDSNKVNTTCD